MRLIDADALDMFDVLNGYYGDAWRDAQNAINHAPTIDAVKVVRCRDCRWFDKGENEVDSWEYCTRLGHHPQSDGYCAWGDRRE